MPGCEDFGYEFLRKWSLLRGVNPPDFLGETGKRGFQNHVDILPISLHHPWCDSSPKNMTPNTWPQTNGESLGSAMTPSFHIACRAARDFGGAHGRFPWEQGGSGASAQGQVDPQVAKVSMRGSHLQGGSLKRNLHDSMAGLLKVTRVDKLTAAPLPKNGQVSSLKEMLSLSLSLSLSILYIRLF